MMPARQGTSGAQTWRSGDVDYDRTPASKRGSQTFRDSREIRPSLERGEEGHVRDCLVWNAPTDQPMIAANPPMIAAEMRQREKDRVKRWYCCSENRCNETFYRRKFCRENHVKNGEHPYGRRQRPCSRPHCPERPCTDDDCADKHCQDEDCPESAGCHEANCRTCRGLDAKTDRDTGYVRRIQLGRPRDRGLSWSPPRSARRSAREIEGSAGEALAGWPKPMKRHGQLEPLPQRNTALSQQQESANDLWKMPRFVNGAKPKVASFRDPEDPAMPNSLRSSQPNSTANFANYPPLTDINRNQGLSELESYRQSFPRVANQHSDQPTSIIKPTKTVQWQSDVAENADRQQLYGYANTAPAGYGGMPSNQDSMPYRSTVY